MEYKVIIVKEQLSKTVNKYIKEGWEPLSSPYWDNSKWHQALIKYDNPMLQLVEDIKLKLL